MMKTKYITLTKENIGTEHICCAFSDKKCKEGYELKKEWLRKEFDNGYVFRRLDERAKGCGHGKALLQSAIDDARSQGKAGLVTVAGTSKFHFMSDTKWLLRQGFQTVEKLPNGFSLLVLKLMSDAPEPSFKACTKSGECEEKNGLVVYFTNRCPYTEYHVLGSLADVAQSKGIPLKIIKLETLEQAQAAPTPATIFTLFHNGQFVTTDLSVCLEKRFEKAVKI